MPAEPQPFQGLSWLLLGAAVALLLAPLRTRLEGPPENHRGGVVTARALTDARRLSESGLLRTALTPPSTDCGSLLRPSRPALGPALGALSLRIHGDDAAAIRITGLCAAVLLAFAAFLLARRLFPPVAALAASCGVLAMPATLDAAHVGATALASLAAGAWGLFFGLAWLDRGGGARLAACGLLLFAGAALDWCGHATTAVVAVAALLLRPAPSRPRASSLALAAIAASAAAIGLFLLRCALVGDWSGAEAALAALVPSSPKRLGGVLLDGLGAAGVGALGAAVLVAVGGARGRRFLGPLLACAALGLLACLPGADPTWRSPCFAPAVGLGFGIVAQVVAAAGGDKARISGAVAALIVPIALVSSGFLRPMPVEAALSGADQAVLARAMSRSLPEQEAIVVACYPGCDLDLLQAALRRDVVLRPDLDAGGLAALRRDLRAHYRHCPEARCFVFVAPRPEDPEARRANEALRAALTRQGRPVGHALDANVFELPDWSAERP